MDASLAELIRLYAPTAPGRVPDWAAAERDLGTALPADYRDLVGAFGAGLFDGHVWLLEPDSPDASHDLVADNDGRMEDFEDFWEMGEDKPEQLEEEGSRLVAWGSTYSGEVLYWLVRPGVSPDAWTVMVNESRGPRWEHHDLTCTAFLAGVLTGRVRSGILASRLPAPEHSFRPVGAGA
ncbi:SMI1/KNR4 family protein [Streptantibioticus parmotrematis]|uniref:SMI1/KNR4 family protein n=1 Tax=Streptantibioticus parmotrematis TaxID=2873249 RepID=UPI0033C18BA2